MAIGVTCQTCKKHFRADEKYAGKRVKCPACGGVLHVPAPADHEGPRDFQRAAADPCSEYQLAGEGGSGASSATQTDSAVATGTARRKCPSCQQPLADNAVLCVQCGHDLRSGKKIEASVAPSAAIAKANERKEQAHGLRGWLGLLRTASCGRSRYRAWWRRSEG